MRTLPHRSSALWYMHTLWLEPERPINVSLTVLKGSSYNIANFVCLWKCRMILSVQGHDYTHVFRQFKAPLSAVFHRDLPLCFENVLPGLLLSFLASSICFSFVCPFLRELSTPMITVEIYSLWAFNDFKDIKFLEEEWVIVILKACIVLNSISVILPACFKTCM